jgi:geranylgeranyl diphosphate synthase, type I
MTLTHIPATAARTSAPEVLTRLSEIVQPALKAAVSTMTDDRMRLIASYQLGWCDEHGRPAQSGGKAIRPALALLSAEAALGRPDCGIPGAVAIELVHNFSLLHDDLMDRDVTRRHRPTGWVAFGEGDAILAGNALLTLAVQVLIQTGVEGRRSLPHLMDATQRLISGQSLDIGLENRGHVELDEVLAMEAGKTASLLACASSIGALAAGAPEHMVRGLESFGYEMGMAFQLVDDILGVVGDPARTGKSSSSDVRAGKRSAPIVAALTSGTAAGDRLAELFAVGSLDDDVVELATSLIEEAGGLAWAAREADTRLARALDHLAPLALTEPAATGLAEIASFIVARDR